MGVKLNMPLLPAFISGTDNAWAKGTKIPKPYQVRVSFGKPIYPSTYCDDQNDNKKILEKLTNDLSESISELENSLFHA